jgi:hypothetical protein
MRRSFSSSGHFFVLASCVLAAEPGCSHGPSGAPCSQNLYSCACGDPPLSASSPVSSCSAAGLGRSPAACCDFGDAGGSCECATYVCGQTADGATCRCDWAPAYFVGSGVPAYAAAIVDSCTGTHCCVESQALIDLTSPVHTIEAACICGQFACTSNTIEVDHCGADNPPPACRSTVVAVAECTP